MSANKDKEQRASFVYSNLYQLYQKGKEAAKDAVIPPPPPEETKPGLMVRTPAGHVLRSEDWKEKLDVRSYEPVQLMGRRIQAIDTRPVATKIQAQQAMTSPARVSEPVKSLKDNLNRLQDLHSRLDFMLKELEDLMK